MLSMSEILLTGPNCKGVRRLCASGPELHFQLVFLFCQIIIGFIPTLYAVYAGISITVSVASKFESAVSKIVHISVTILK